MPADYSVLAPIYEPIGMAEFASRMTPRLLDYAQRHEWVGRRILDLGCGSGSSLRWLAERSYIVTGIDSSPQMLELARMHLDPTASRLNFSLHERDIRELGDDLGGADLALGLDVMNELNSLRDLEIAFREVHRVLNEERLFVFDMHTIQGLAAHGRVGDQIVQNNSQIAVFASNQYDYDRQVHERRYIIFHRRDDVWVRNEASRILRAFPAQAVATLLQRCGFRNTIMLNTELGVFDPGVETANRIIFMAEKG